MYKGPVLYFQAETCLCKKIQTNAATRKCFCRRAVGTAFDCWSSLFAGNTLLVQCSGDHFSMVEKSRGQDIGKILATSASLMFRRHSPLARALKLNANHDTAKDICKSRGMKVCMIKGSGSFLKFYTYCKRFYYSCWQFRFLEGMNTCDHTSCVVSNMRAKISSFI